MIEEKEQKLKSKLIQRLVGDVSFAEIVKIVHELAKREVNQSFPTIPEEEKESLYKELFGEEDEKSKIII